VLPVRLRAGLSSVLMTDRPLVSILTPTYNRPELLLEAMQNVRDQTYRPLEHVIVHDGPSPGLEWRCKWDAFAHQGERFVPIRFVELGHNTSSTFPDSYCAAPNIVAGFVASGELHSWLADDERMHPDYLATMVDALEATGADFAYPRVAYTRWDMPGFGVGIGCDPPRVGAITTLVYRAALLRHGLYRWQAGRESDWGTIKQWMDAGATWTFVDSVLFSHRDDRGCPPERYADPLPADALGVLGA
jgi:hypothetical protein